MIGGEDVYFYVNGPARLLLACVIAEELYPSNRKHLILLQQYGYDYDALLPHVQERFTQVVHHRVTARKYTSLDQWLHVYWDPHLGLRHLFRPGSRVILFGIRSPTQKWIVRHNRRMGNVIDVYAEGLSVDRYFSPSAAATGWRGFVGGIFPRAFRYQHDYDTFFVVEPGLYRNSPHAHKLARMVDLYGSRSFRAFAELMTRHVQIDGLDQYDTVFLGQPLSNFETFLTPEEEERILREVIGDQRVLILPHPNERLNPGQDKYRGLPHARVFRAKANSELLLARLRPARTITYYSTAGINYALMNPVSRNQFYPVHRSVYDLLTRFQEFVPNIEVHGKYLVGDHPYDAPRRLTRPVTGGLP